MEASIMSRIITPLAIAFIMFGMGLSLTLDDFKRVWIYPKVIFTGIFLQIICLPILGFCFVSILNLEPIMATSIMVLSACPGGAITNLVSFISKGDTALSVSLTAVNSLITVITIPILVTFSIEFFMGEKMAAQVDSLELSLGIILVTIPPILLGMFTRKMAPKFAQDSESSVKKGTILFLVVLASFAVYSEKQLFMEHYGSFTLMAAGLCILSFFMGGLVSTLLGFPRRHILTLAIEVGLHNSAMGIMIAISFLGINALGIFSAFYLIIEYVLSGILMTTMNSPMGIKILGDET
jgi:bile acid:Na+ symporter, BASS family